jgi:hypothetical protein
MSGNEPHADERARAIRRHLVFGWGALFVFATLGMVLELLHGLKVGWYLAVSNDTRRLMWTLAHAHGTLLALVHLAYAATLSLRPASAPPRVVSGLLVAASLLLPGGFLLGGIWLYEGDPGLGIFLVPAGAACLLAGLGAIFLGTARGPRA